MARTKARTLYLVKRAETAVRRGLESSLSDLSMTPGQYVTLSLLAVHDQSSADLARKTGVTPQSMSEIIGMLERKFLIARVENPEHRRILTTRLTDQGLDVLRQCDKRARVLEDKLLKGLSAAQIEALRNALDLIARNGHGY